MRPSVFCVMLALPQQFESMFELTMLVEDHFFCSFVCCLLDNVFMSRELISSLVSELLQFDRYRFPCHILIDSCEP